MYLQYSHPLIYHLLPNVWKASYRPTISTSIFVYVPYWPPYSKDKFISCVLPGPSQWFFQFWRRNRMYIWGFRARQHLRSLAPVIDDNDGQMIFGDLVGLKLPDNYLTGEEKPQKTSPRKFVTTGDRTRARCVTGAHVIACSTAVDRRGRNHMDSYQVSTVDVPESPITSNTKGPW